MIYFYIWLPSQVNTGLYKISLLADNETVFDEKYTNTLKLSSFITTRNTLYIPKLGYGLSFVWDMYIPSRGGNDMWQHNFNTLKPIISMQDSPIISYHPKKNYLSITVKYRNNPFYAQFAEVKFDNIKQQKWYKYIIIIETRNIKLYIDGILVAIKTLPSVIEIYDISSEIILGQIDNNFLGKIKNLSLYPYPLNNNEISSL